MTPCHPAGIPGPAGTAPVELARDAAESLRWLNHAARRPGGLDEPAAAYDVLGALAAAAACAGQAIAHVTTYLTGSAGTGHLGHDYGDDPRQSAGAAAAFLAGAQLSAASLAGELDAARQEIALLHARQPVAGAGQPGKDGPR